METTTHRTLVTLLFLSLCGLPSCLPGPAAPETGDAGGWLPDGADSALEDGGALPPADAGPRDDLGSATLAGQVTLAQAPTNAGVTATLQPGAQVQTTDAEGSFVFPSVAAGPYALTFSAPGYRPVTVKGLLVAGEDGTASATLERSWPLAGLAGVAGFDGGGASPAWLRVGGDGGAVFLGDGVALALIDLDAGVARPVAIGDGGYRWLGFDPAGGAVVTTGDPRGATFATFVDPAGSVTLPLGSGVEALALIGDRVAFGADAGPERLNWSAWGPADLSALTLENDALAEPASPARAAGWLFGWTDAYGQLAPVLFGPEVFVELAQTPSRTANPVWTSLDGDRALFTLTDPGSGRWQALGFSVAQQNLYDDRELGLRQPDQLYPLTASSYLGAVNDDGGVWVYVDSADGGPCFSQQVAAWVPLHGEGALIEGQLDGGPALAVIGRGAPVMIPFEHVWSPPQLSPDSRFLIVPGVPSIFDLVAGVEVPVVLTPASVSFDPALRSALLLNSGGVMATVELKDLAASSGPQGTQLEGTATAASFTSDGTAVVYLGTDALGATGLFVQPVP